MIERLVVCMLLLPPAVLIFDYFMIFNIFALCLYIHRLAVDQYRARVSMLTRDKRNLITEAQLSQRDRATLRVTEYFAKSLKVIRNDTVEYGVCKSLLVFY